MAVGYPLGMHSVKSGKGIVSGYQQVSKALFLSITAPINPGNSGGPLYNTDGKVVGINSAKFESAARMAFAIPSVQLKVMLDGLYQNRQWLVPDPGFMMSKGSAELNQFLTGMKATGGVFVRKVLPQGLFAQAGVEAGDLLLALDRRKISRNGKVNLKELKDRVNIHGLLARKKVGSRLDIHVFRSQPGKGGGKLMRLSTLYNQTPRPYVKMIYEPIVDQPKFQIVAGIVFMELSLNLAQVFIDGNPTEMVPYMQREARFKSPALVVTSIVPNSIAGGDGSVKKGQLVQEVNGVPVKSFETLCNALRSTTRWWTLKTRKSFTALDAAEVHADLEKAMLDSTTYGRISTGCAFKSLAAEPLAVAP